MTARAPRSRSIQRAMVLVFLVLVLGACAAGANPTIDVASADGHTAGFWTGLWHGFIAPFAFIVSIFNDNVSIYEVHNTGLGYNFGFLLSIGSFMGSGGRSTRRTKTRSNRPA